MKNLTLFIGLLFSVALCSCSSGSDGANGSETPEPTPTSQTETKLRINISASAGSMTESRATETAFEANDKIGLYVVNRSSDGTAGTLAASGNHVDNMRFTYSGTWTPDTQIYWQDNTTHADFYLYYPYTASVSSVTAMPFSLKADQSQEADYKACDLMIGSTANVAPTETAVSISAKHVMSQIRIIVEAGNGFTAESLAAASVSVKVNGIKTQATANLSTGEVTATGDAASITPFNADGVYKAFIAPQSVAESSLITVTVDGREFNLTKGFTFNGGQSHKFTVTVSKTSNGINVNITKWEDDGTDNGGTAE